jgi:hypothetical protein
VIPGDISLEDRAQSVLPAGHTHECCIVGEERQSLLDFPIVDGCDVCPESVLQRNLLCTIGDLHEAQCGHQKHD